MTKRAKIIEALLIAEAVDPDGPVWAGHDVFSIGQPDTPFTDEQKRRLTELGFRKSDDYGWYCYT